MGIILGNVFSLCASISDTLSSSRKTAKGVLLVQCLSQVFYLASTLALKGYSAAVQNAVSIFRNLAAISKKENKLVEWILVILGVVLGLVFNNRGFIGLLPVVANLEYTLAVFRFKDNERALKIAFAICIALFMVFNVALLNFVGAITNAMVLVMTIIFVVKGGKS
ncbi:MAG: YgjV family protein [Lachnospiraceae bacterium]|nr:YgjV family protein [Lachnospiraceae bacterium]